MKINQKTIKAIGRLGSVLAIIMFLSQLEIAYLNIQGVKGPIVISISTFFNCILWSIYAYSRKDRPLFSCNVVGVFTALAATITYFL